MVVWSRCFKLSNCVWNERLRDETWRYLMFPGLRLPALPTRPATPSVHRVLAGVRPSPRSVFSPTPHPASMGFRLQIGKGNAEKKITGTMFTREEYVLCSSFSILFLNSSLGLSYTTKSSLWKLLFLRKWYIHSWSYTTKTLKLNYDRKANDAKHVMQATSCPDKTQARSGNHQVMK